MNNYFLNTIRFSVAILMALFFFVGQVFAETAITPVSVQAVSDTSIRLSAYGVNDGKTVTAWFEWGETENPTTASGLTRFLNKGTFETKLTNLTPGTKYYFRAAMMENGTTIYSPVGSYTPGVKPKTTTVVKTETVEKKTDTSNTKTTTSKQTDVVAQNSKEKTTSGTYNTGNGSRVETYETQSATNNSNNTASVVGVSSNPTLPSTLTGWVLLFIAILFMFLILQMIADTRKERRVARELEEKRKLEERYKETR